jgi:hypothetical protein
VEYRPLDDELKSEIRDQLHEQKIREEIEKRIDTVMSGLQKLERERSSKRRAIVKADQSIEPKDRAESFGTSTQHCSKECRISAKNLDSPSSKHDFSPHVTSAPMTSSPSEPLRMSFPALPSFKWSSNSSPQKMIPGTTPTCSLAKKPSKISSQLKARKVISCGGSQSFRRRTFQN